MKEMYANLKNIDVLKVDGSVTDIIDGVDNPKNIIHFKIMNNETLRRIKSDKNRFDYQIGTVLRNDAMDTRFAIVAYDTHCDYLIGSVLEVAFIESMGIALEENPDIVIDSIIISRDDFGDMNDEIIYIHTLKKLLSVMRHKPYMSSNGINIIIADYNDEEGDDITCLLKKKK